MGMNEKGPTVGDLQPVDSDTARAACVLVLGVLFVGRTLKNFGIQTPVYEESKGAARDELVMEARKGGEALNRTPKKNSTSERCCYHSIGHSTNERITDAGKKTKVQ